MGSRWQASCTDHQVPGSSGPRCFGRQQISGKHQGTAQLPSAGAAPVRRSLRSRTGGAGAGLLTPQMAHCLLASRATWPAVLPAAF